MIPVTEKSVLEWSVGLCNDTTNFAWERCLYANLRQLGFSVYYSTRMAHGNTMLPVERRDYHPLSIQGKADKAELLQGPK